MTNKEKEAFEILQKEIAELKELLAKALENTDESLKLQLAEKDLLIESLQSLVNDQSDKIKELENTAVAVTEDSKKSFKEPVTFEGEDYYFTKKQFRLIGDSTLYQAEEAKTNPDVLKKILAIPDQQILLTED